MPAGRAGWGSALTRVRSGRPLRTRHPDQVWSAGELGARGSLEENLRCGPRGAGFQGEELQFYYSVMGSH